MSIELSASIPLRHKQIFVFVPGIFGFGHIPFVFHPIQYFRGVQRTLEQEGFAVDCPTVPSFRSIRERATVLAQRLEQLGSEQIYLIGHSMGGLDCRYVVHHCDVKRRIQAVATIATPHRGTPLAQWFCESKNVAGRFIQPWIKSGVRELTPETCAMFNSQVPLSSEVRFLSYAASRSVDEMPVCFRPWTRMLAETAGPNDSHVPVSSAMWGNFQEIVRADHFEVTGWSLGMANEAIQRPFGSIPFYRRIVQQLSTLTRRPRTS